MSHVSSGDRVYMVGPDSYGDVQRTTFLGKPGVVVFNDDGSMGGLTEKDTVSSVINKTTKKNGLGENVEMPMDVRVEGIPILAALNISPENQKFMFIKFTGMFTKEVKRAYVKEWKEKKDDPVQRTLFLNNLIEVLDNDEVFISTEGQKALVDIDPEIQKKMFTKFLTSVDKTTREKYIVEWIVVKNTVEKKNEFLQKMYELLMEDEDYIQMEGRRALTELNISQRDQVSIFSKFLREITGQERAAYIAQWRTVRRSYSMRRLFLKKLIGLIDA